MTDTTTNTNQPPKQTTLYYREGSSDKVYCVSLEPDGNPDHFLVRFAFGRRGSTLQTGTKTPAPADYDTALKTYNQLVAAKLATQLGGTTDDGTIFGVTPDGTIETVHSFDEATEGKAPGTRLVPDGSGNYLGTCDLEGPNDGGTIYQLVLTPMTQSATALRGLKPQYADPIHAFGYAIRLIFGGDVDSPAKEFAEFVNNLHGSGPLFKVGRPAGTGEIDQYATPPQGLLRGPSANVDPTYGLSTLYQFTGGADGSGPRGALIPGPDGNDYGVTAFGGANGLGTVYRLTPDGVLTTLHAFAGGGDGAVPQGGLVLASDGNFYGTTSGNAYDANTSNVTGTGTIFRVALDGTFTTLHVFADDSTQANNPAEGKRPLAALVQASDGNLYGTTSAGGYGGDGAVFSITAGGVFTKVGDLADPALFGFDGENSTTGATPMAALIQGSDGNLYGTTTRGGTEQGGVVFKVTLGSGHHPFFNGEAVLGENNYYLALPDGTVFGYYAYLDDPHYIYHYDLGYEYVFDNTDAQSGVYFYDFASDTFFYTSPGTPMPFPFLYDFSLNTVLYYYPASNPQAPHTYTNDPRYFYDFATGQTITK